MFKKLKENSLASGSAIYLLSNIINAAVPLALIPILTRHLSPTEYGTVGMFQILLGALGALVGLNVVGAAGRKYYDGNLGAEDLKHFMASCMQIILASSVAIFLVLLIFSDRIGEWLNLEARWIYWAVFVTATLNIGRLLLNQWVYRKDAIRFGIFQNSQSGLTMALSILWVVTLPYGADGRISAQIWSAGIFGIIALILLNRNDLFSFFIWNSGFIKEALRFGVPLIPHVGGMFLLGMIDRFVVNAELGLSEAGIYIVAAQLAAALSILFDAVNKSYIPWLFERLKRNQPTENRQLVLYTYGWFSLVLLGAGFAFVVGPWFVMKIAGPEYARASEFVGWLFVGQAFNGMYQTVGNYVFYSKRTGLLALVTITSGLINIALLLVLTKSLGLKGAAIAFTISMMVRFVLTWLLAQRCHPMPWLTSLKGYPTHN